MKSPNPMINHSLVRAVAALAIGWVMTSTAAAAAPAPPDGNSPPATAAPAVPDPQGAEPAPAPAEPTPAPAEPAAGPAEPAATPPTQAPPRIRSTPSTPVIRSARPFPPVAQADGGVRLNFQGTPLSEVLNYLSEAAGFVIVQEQPVKGTVNVVSHQPLTADEAVDLLNTILVEKGYVALRSGRILKIVAREGAHRLDLPVRVGSNPSEIPRKDEMVTQIIPVRYADALKVIENLRPLLAEDASLTANESSNAILLTDTLTNIRRMAEIIRALDTSIAGISAIRVFPLEYADATQLATVIKELFAGTGATSQRSGGRSGGFFDRFRMGGPEGGDRGGRGGGGGSSGQSEARQAASRVVAVADERSNSLVVSAPEELLPTIEQIVAEMDTNIADPTEVRIFRLENADAQELADLFLELYPDETSSNRNSSQGFRPPWMPPREDRNQGGSSQRTLVQSKVIAVGDRRTNSLLVSAPRQLMSHIAEMIGRLDASSEKKQRVFVVPLEHADADNVAAILRGMFEGQGTGAGTARNAQAINPLTDRTATGASSDITSSFTSGRVTR